MIHCMRNYVDKGVVIKIHQGQRTVFSTTSLIHYVLKTTTVQRKSALTLPFGQDVENTLYVLAKESF